MILQGLPERERVHFLRQYHEAVDAAHDPAGFRRLRQVLRVWSLAVGPVSERLGVTRVESAF